MDQRPEPSHCDGPDVHARHEAMMSRAWGLVGSWHRRAFRVFGACRDDVRLLNPGGSGEHLEWALESGAISIAMEEADVPKSQRAATRAIVKTIRDVVDGKGRSSLWSSICMGSGCGNEPAGSWRERCPDGTPGCKCRLWWRAFELAPVKAEAA